jgi:hypothetical protein
MAYIYKIVNNVNNKIYRCKRSSFSLGNLVKFENFLKFLYNIYVR